ncbi:MAG: DNA topoisomerase VI subunit B [Candidatus Methanohalarchaeum thermophilum]|uniref:Type 2 DNA topoisomerase 6 subunit B n=1 Tax=Methanohalarchaeum thermophilum TaxID=1903181 RepID=A0A1Q6DUB0_METT1|nr:MAG: DNA topoisomerase VI subunit B [Candidatus Methanohalarchaeum thermophilum]
MGEKPVAEELAKNQRKISIAEFFEKNRQILGFDSTTRSLITAVKEGVDNALDATEEAGYLPDIYVELEELKDDEYQITIEDNGPGIVKEEIPRIFGKLLYGSRFHKFVQSLTPQQEILIKKDEEVKFVEIGKLCDKYVGKEPGTEDIDEEIKAPCFNRKTGEIKWRNITHAIKHRRKNEVYKVKTKNGREIKVTGNHSLFTFKNGEIKEVKAEDLDRNDKILAPSKIPSSSGRDKLNILKYFNPDELNQHNLFVSGVSKRLVEKIKEKGTKVVKYEGDSDRQRILYKIKDMEIRKDTIDFVYLPEKILPANLISKLGWEDEVKDKNLLSVSRKKEEFFPVSLKIDEDLVKILGYYTTGKFSSLIKTLDQVKSNKKLSKREIGIKKGKNAVINEYQGKLNLNEDLLLSFCKKITKTRTGNKKVPNFIFSLKDFLQEEYLRSLSLNVEKFRLSTESRRFARDISLLLNMRNKTCNLIEKQTENNSKTYQITLKQDSIDQIGDLTLLEVSKTQKIIENKPNYVYDISVPGSGKDENFMAGNKGLLCAKNSRGQQGVGISAAVLYGQLTTGKPAKVVSSISPEEPAHEYEITIDTEKNEPEIVSEREVDWTRPHGTKIELNLTGMYIRGRKQSIYNYLKDTAIVNSHARITFVDPYGEKTVFERAVSELPEKPNEIKPHPEGIELGTLMKMLDETERQKISSFLKKDFSKVGRKTVQKIGEASELDLDRDPSDIGRKEAKKLLNAFEEVKLISPPTDCLSPIQEENIEKGLKKEYPDADLIEATTRSSDVYSGNPFLVEAGIAYGVDEPEDEKIDILRFANRVPLLYQKGGCLITKVLKSVDWRRYELNQPGGSGIPKDNAVLLVHVASTNIPFTSESKDAIAKVDKIEKEIERAVREVGRSIGKHLKRQKKMSKRKNKRDTLAKILPDLSEKVEEITGRSIERDDLDPVLARITNNLLINTSISENEDHYSAEIEIKNYDKRKKEIDIHTSLDFELLDAEPEPEKILDEDELKVTWSVSLSSGQYKRIRLKINSSGKPDLDLAVSGVPEEILTGAQVIEGGSINE